MEAVRQDRKERRCEGNLYRSLPGLGQAPDDYQAARKEFGAEGVCSGLHFPLLMGGSLFTIFPLLKVLKEKGARIGAIASFSRAWGGKVPLLPLGSQFLGWSFALVRLWFTILLAFVMGFLMDWVGENTEKIKQEKSFLVDL